MLQDFLINNSRAINYIIIFIACFLIGYCLSSIRSSKKAEHTVEKRLLSDTYYAYAIISFKFKTIDWYCGNIRIGSDSYTLLEESKLAPGFYNGFIHDSILTIIDLEDNKTSTVYLELEDESPVRALLINSFPIIVIH